MKIFHLIRNTTHLKKCWSCLWSSVFSYYKVKKSVYVYVWTRMMEKLREQIRNNYNELWYSLNVDTSLWSMRIKYWIRNLFAITNHKLKSNIVLNLHLFFALFIQVMKIKNYFQYKSQTKMPTMHITHILKLLMMVTITVWLQKESC